MISIGKSLTEPFSAYSNSKHPNMHVAISAQEQSFSKNSPLQFSIDLSRDNLS